MIETDIKTSNRTTALEWSIINYWGGGGGNQFYGPYLTISLERGLEKELGAILVRTVQSLEKQSLEKGMGPNPGFRRLEVQRKDQF